MDDAADALLRLALDPAAGTGPLNVGSGESPTLREVGVLLARALDAQPLLRIGELPYHADEILDYRVSIARLVERTGWRPAVPRAEGLARLVAAR